MNPNGGYDMAMMPISRSEKPDYGIDARGVVRNFLVFGAFGTVMGTAQFTWREELPPWMAALMHLCFWIGLSFLLTGLVMLWGSKVGKVRFRDLLIQQLNLKGNERVLDVGCGRGLILIGVAQRLTSGRAVGIDQWDQSRIAITTTEENSRRAGVAGRIELHTGDFRQLPFAAASFDVVVASWTIRTIREASERREVLAEMVRVLKPGGQMIVFDTQNTAEYANVMRELGVHPVRLWGPSFLTVIPTYTVSGRR
jgi:SAM-dependent methyltransferase